MPSRNGPVHVATTRRIYKGKLYETHLLRRTFREGGKVKHETLGNLSHLSSEIIEMIRASLRGEPCLPVSKSFRIVRSFPHGHVAAILGTLRKIGLEEILSSRPCQERNLVVAMIAARIIKPGSKLATARMLQVQTVTSSLSVIIPNILPPNSASRALRLKAGFHNRGGYSNYTLPDPLWKAVV